MTSTSSELYDELEAKTDIELITICSTRPGDSPEVTVAKRIMADRNRNRGSKSFDKMFSQNEKILWWARLAVGVAIVTGLIAAISVWEGWH